MGVLLLVSVLPTGTPALRMIVTAALPVGSGVLVVSDPAIMLMLGGLSRLALGQRSMAFEDLQFVLRVTV